MRGVVPSSLAISSTAPTSELTALKSVMQHEAFASTLKDLPLLTNLQIASRVVEGELAAHGVMLTPRFVCCARPSQLRMGCRTANRRFGTSRRVTCSARSCSKQAVRRKPKRCTARI